MSLLLQSSRKCSESSCQFCCILKPSHPCKPPKQSDTCHWTNTAKPSKNTNLGKGKCKRKVRAVSDLEKELFGFFFQLQLQSQHTESCEMLGHDSNRSHVSPGSQTAAAAALCWRENRQDNLSCLPDPRRRWQSWQLAKASFALVN